MNWGRALLAGVVGGAVSVTLSLLGYGLPFYWYIAAGLGVSLIADWYQTVRR